VAFNANTYFPKVPPVPNMPMAPREWGTSYQDQFSNILRLYLNQVTGLLSALMSPRGGRYLSSPNGSFYDSTDLIAASTTTAYPIPLANTYANSGVTVSNTSQIRVSAPGTYNIQVSAQLANSTNDGQDIDLWFRKNNVDIPDSNSRMGLPPRKSSGTPSHNLLNVSFFVNMQGDDYVELVWSTTNVGAYIEAFPAGTSPTRPAIPSLIVNVAFVSAPL
jgi:hypothetical protein